MDYLEANDWLREKYFLCMAGRDRFEVKESETGEVQWTQKMKKTYDLIVLLLFHLILPCWLVQVHCSTHQT